MIFQLVKLLFQSRSLESYKHYSFPQRKPTYFKVNTFRESHSLYFNEENKQKTFHFT